MGVIIPTLSGSPEGEMTCAGPTLGPPFGPGSAPCRQGFLACLRVWVTVVVNKILAQGHEDDSVPFMECWYLFIVLLPLHMHSARHKVKAQPYLPGNNQGSWLLRLPLAIQNKPTEACSGEGWGIWAWICLIYFKLHPLGQVTASLVWSQVSPSVK